MSIIANGSMVYGSMKAADLLEAQGIAAGVVNMHTVKPLDKEAVDTAMAGSKLLVTVEEHSVIGGLGSAVANINDKN